MRIAHAIILSLLIGIVLIGVIQFSIPTLFSADGYLHIRMAERLRDKGPLAPFPWTRYSVFSRYFADKDFLYHVFLIPFTYCSDIFFGAKLSAAVGAAVLLLIYALMLVRYCRTKQLIPYFIAAFFLSAHFLSSISQPRNMVVAIALTFLFIDALIKKDYWVLFLLTLLYSLTHVSGPYLLLFAFIAEAVRFASDGEFSKDTLGAVALGLVAGVLVHPQFPNNLLIFYLNGILVPLFALKWGLELGAEFFPMNTRDYVLTYPLLTIAVLAVLSLAVSSGRKARTATQIWMGVSGFFFVFSFFSQRYLVHAYPLVLVALAAYLSDWWQARPGALIPARSTMKFRAVTGSLIIVAFAFLGYRTCRDLRERLLSERMVNGHYEAVGRWMAQNIPAGEVIFHSNWSDSQYFIGLNPRDDYFVTLDPIYMYWWNKELYQRYREVAFGDSTDPYGTLHETFGVRYGYVGKLYFSRLIAQIRPDPRFEVLAEDGLGLVFRLK